MNVVGDGVAGPPIRNHFRSGYMRYMGYMYAVGLWLQLLWQTMI